MALEKQVYRCLEDIVGTENISEEPAVLDAYAHHAMFASNFIGTGWWMPRFEAVLLPGNTKEVQAIVKACNRWKIKFKAHSTGNGAFMNPLREGGCIGLDMRRMSHIIEINEKDMYAVLEPAVIGAQLHAELMKKGLVTGEIGPGGFTSAFPIVCADGGGPFTTAWGQMHRNLLGLEWVLPSGEIMRTGSLGQGAGWFASEGPGPSLRGLASGSACTMGGTGVFTKGATKLYHWPGPPVLPVEGISPKYRLKPQPWFGAWYFTVPSFEKLADAAYKIGLSEVAIMMERTPAWMLADDSSESRDHALKQLVEVTAQTQGKGRLDGYLVLIGADTPREFKYKEKTLLQIIKDVDGELIPFMEDPDRKAGFLSRYLRTSICARYMMSAGSTGVKGGGVTPVEDSPDHCIGQARASANIRAEYLKTGLMWGPNGTDAAYGHMCEQTRASATESGIEFIDTEEGRAAAAESVQLYMERRVDPKYKLSCWLAERRPDMLADDEKIAPAFTKKPYFNKKFWANELSWVRQIRKALDPNDVAESTLFSGE
jgi:hypothetical protein